MCPVLAATNGAPSLPDEPLTFGRSHRSGLAANNQGQKALAAVGAHRDIRDMVAAVPDFDAMRIGD